MSDIKLVKVDYFNFEDLVKLTVADNQKNFVASNLYSLAEAYAAEASKGYALPFGIYLDDKPIGFIMFGYYPDLDYAKQAFGEDEEIPDYIPGSYLIWRFMIDVKSQNKGYGKEAMKLALEFIRTFPCGEADRCWLSYDPANTVAKHLYRSFGFEEMKMPEGWDEIPAVLEL